MNHEKYMQRVIELAKQGIGYVNPNPLVGCVIVKNDKIIAEAYHQKYGEFHAERNAINSLKNTVYQNDLADACLYVNLEPCSHFGKTPPCTDIIINSGIKKVIIGAEDKNEKVNGSGITELKKHGIEVVTGVLAKECLELNQIFYHYIQTKTPYLLMKFAMTMDGKIASYTGDSKWITSNTARNNVHLTRKQYSAIMVGIGTVLKDDPLLTCRIAGGVDPIRIVLDTKLRIPLNSNIIKTAQTVKTIIVSASTDQGKIENIKKMGAIHIKAKKKQGKIDLNQLMQTLAKMEIDSILLEGGAELNFSALEAKIVNKIQAYIAPKIIGSNQAFSPVGGTGVKKVNKAFMLKNQKIYTFEPDIMIESEVDYTCLQE